MYSGYCSYNGHCCFCIRDTDRNFSSQKEVTYCSPLNRLFTTGRVERVRVRATQRAAKYNQNVQKNSIIYSRWTIQVLANFMSPKKSILRSDRLLEVDWSIAVQSYKSCFQKVVIFFRIVWSEKNNVFRKLENQSFKLDLRFWKLLGNFCFCNRYIKFIILEISIRWFAESKWTFPTDKYNIIFYIK